MVTPRLPHQTFNKIGYKLLFVLDFKGKKGEKVAKTLSVFVERFSKEQFQSL